MSGGASASNPPFLTLSPLRDRHSRPILLLHTAHFPPPSTTPAEIAATIEPILYHLPPSVPLTLVLLHAGKVSETPTTRAGVYAVRAAFENDTIVPAEVRGRIQTIVTLHVSFLTRTHIYLSSFGMLGGEYHKLVYCDLLDDLEKELGVDSTLLGLERIDFDYDEQMRYWVDRQHEHKPVQAPDPGKPLLDLDNLDFTRAETVLKQPGLGDTITPVAQP